MQCKKIVNKFYRVSIMNLLILCPRKVSIPQEGFSALRSTRCKMETIILFIFRQNHILIESDQITNYMEPTKQHTLKKKVKNKGWGEP